MSLINKRKIKFYLILPIILLMVFLPLAKVFAEGMVLSVLVRYNAPQCSDGIDNDGDGYIDYPDDPGCSSPTDDDESDHPIEPQQPSAPIQGQGNYNPPSPQPPQEQELPVWLKINTINDQYLSDLTIPYQFTDRMLTIKGQTNVNNAVIFIKLSDNPNITYTTNIYNEDGYWQWLTPYILPLGNYTLEVLALNPSDPTITTTNSIYFQIVEQIIPPPPVATTTPPIIPPVTPPVQPPVIPPTIPGEIIPPSEYQPPFFPEPQGIPIIGPKGEIDFYSLNVKILNKNKSIYPKDKIQTEIEARYYGEKKNQKLELKFIILDENQKIVTETIQPVTLTDRIIFDKNFLTDFTLRPGRYTIIVELIQDGKIIQSSDTINVLAHPLIKPIYLMGEIESTFGSQLLNLLMILSGIFILFLLGLFIESKRSQIKKEKLLINDLINKHYIDLE